MQKHPLLTSLFSSILPYYELHKTQLPEDLVTLKQEEAITILREVDKNVDNLLANFAQPGKIDLAEFMQKNYSFNISIARFATLTGRSLASFKRDFQKVFNIPGRFSVRKFPRCSGHIDHGERSGPFGV